ncbi:MAG TPA: TRZ/ATZ family protein [Acholeplasmataceae bacterium]|nr:TRZ/ATZ family protein [Acholeplasmataceae bacterium]
MIKLQTPITEENITSLRSGDIVSISGIIYTGRDAAHKKLVDLLDGEKELPFDLEKAIIYYTGPAPKSPGRIIGSCGPTSSYRMDAYSTPLMKQGLRLMIGKGPRSEEHIKDLKLYKGVYLQAVGGTAALISETVKKMDLVAFPELGAEAIYRLEVKNFIATVTYDSLGNDLLKEAINKYKR